MSNSCPICPDPAKCKAYPAIRGRLRRPDGHRWRAIHDRLNGAGSPSLAPVRESIRAARIGYRKCWFSTTQGCGCSGARCHLLGRLVTLRDCLDCPWVRGARA